MSANQSREAAAPGANEKNPLPGGLQGSGSGAASALERMKAERALRHRRQHGTGTSGTGLDDGRAPGC